MSAELLMGQPRDQRSSRRICVPVTMATQGTEVVCCLQELFRSTAEILESSTNCRLGRNVAQQKCADQAELAIFGKQCLQTLPISDVETKILKFL